MTTSLAIVSIVVLGTLYVRCLSYVVSGSRPRFRVTDLLVLSATVAVFSAVGFAWDSLTMVLLILYAGLCGPLWRRFVSNWTVNDIKTAASTSAAILSSFFVMLALASMIVYTFDTMTLKEWNSGYWSMFPTAYISIEYIWHDEARSAFEFFLYGLPFGLPVNIVVGLAVGAALGLIANSIRPVVSE